MKKSHYAIAYTLVITTLLWLLSKQNLQLIFKFPLVSINQISALLGTVLFAWSMVLSTRLKFIENIFDGLDKVYHLHRKVSEYGFALILIHPISLALDNLDQAVETFLPVAGDFATSTGVIAFWIFVYLIVATLFFR